MLSIVVAKEASDLMKNAMKNMYPVASATIAQAAGSQNELDVAT